ncbi:hypothetical protein LCGC14_2350370 [marine sediment metagenome]|uniref:Uncharacterized protein n=1 Tax=marine sediment metagenome TaxID=412755 RepID=A0A0F9EM33_9ZZZZ
MKLSKAQQQIVNDLINYDSSSIQATVTSCGCEWNYLFAKRAEGMHMVMKNGVVMTKMEGFFEMYRPPYHMNQTTIKCLIRKKVLIPTMPDEEFAIQFALGTMEYRIYGLAEAYK